MSDVPERVLYQPGFVDAWRTDLPPERAHIPAVEYIRADKVAALVEALKLYSCGDGCNDCPQSERDRVSCGWTASAALAALDANGGKHE